jgi:serine/threonine-protein kinase
VSEPETSIDPADRCPGCGASVDGSWLVCAWCGGALAAPAELAEGAILDGRYEVRRVIGRGGFGITYEVQDQRLERAVAVKELFPPLAVRHGSMVLAAPRDREAFGEARERFLREARVLARFTQSGIVHVYEVFEAHNTAYLVMELLSGRTLSDLQRARGRPFSAEEVLDTAARVAGALEPIHEAGLLHRDVNPSNVMLTDQGRVVLIDFGLARRFDGETGQSMTRAVTPGYAPPEQYAGTGDFGPACDVYGMAATLYRLLTGHTPVGAFDRQAGTRLPSPIELDPQIPRLVSDAVLDGLELNPHHRPADAAAFLDRLGRHDIEPPRISLLLDAADVRDTLAGRSSAPARPAAPSPVARVPGPGPGGGVVLGGAAEALGGVSPVAVPVAAAPAPVEVQVPAPVPAAVPAAAAPARVPPPPARVGTLAPPVRPEPPVVGPLPRGRGLVTVPVAVAVASLASSTPVVVVPLLVLIGLPALATVGDIVVHRYRSDIGADVKAWHRVDARAAAPAFFLRNVLTSILRAIPALLLGAVAVGVAALIGSPEPSSGWRDLVIRLGGIGAVLCLLLPARHGGRGFRSGTGINHLVTEFVDEQGRLISRGWVLMVVSVALTAFGLWLHPELWPLGY